VAAGGGVCCASHHSLFFRGSGIISQDSLPFLQHISASYERILTIYMDLWGVARIDQSLRFWWWSGSGFGPRVPESESGSADQTDFDEFFFRVVGPGLAQEPIKYTNQSRSGSRAPEFGSVSVFEVKRSNIKVDVGLHSCECQSSSYCIATQLSVHQ